MKKILSFILFFFVSNGYVFAQEYTIRVAVLTKKEECRVKIKGNYNLRGLLADEIKNSGKNLDTDVFCSKAGINIGPVTYNLFSIRIEPKKDGAIFINNRPYRGSMLLIGEDEKISVINIILLEDYLKGVLGYEVVFWWPMEVLKAQAVAARSYALYMREINKEKNYDLTSDVLSQMYGGKLGEKWRIKRAVNKTKGIALFFEGKILPAFYHSTCGGHTDRVSNLWSLDILPLKGVPCDFCRYSRHYKWQKKIELDFFKTKLNEAGYGFNNIESVFVKERFDTGYVKTILILADKKEYSVSAKDLRKILGAKYIRSRRFLLEKVKNYIDIKGYGWGHGIGLCQWGAYGMAKAGYDFDEILSYYYPESELKRLE